MCFHGRCPDVMCTPNASFSPNEMTTEGPTGVVDLLTLPSPARQTFFIGGGRGTGDACRGASCSSRLTALIYYLAHVVDRGVPSPVDFQPTVRDAWSLGRVCVRTNIGRAELSSRSRLLLSSWLFEGYGARGRFLPT